MIWRSDVWLSIVSGLANILYIYATRHGKKGSTMSKSIFGFLPLSLLKYTVLFFYYYYGDDI